MIIAVEGIDCSGKGEACSRLAKILGGVIYKTPPESMRAEQDVVNTSFTDEEHYEYFKRVILVASQELKQMVQQNPEVPIIVDRYWMTTVVYHRVMGIEADLSDFGEILMPDVTVYLTVEPEVQNQRFGVRGKSPGDLRMDGRMDKIRLFYNQVIESSEKVCVIDTSYITRNEVIQLVISNIRRLCF